MGAFCGSPQKARSLLLDVQIETGIVHRFRPINHQLTAVLRENVGTLLGRYMTLANQLIQAATKEQLAETACILALNVAHYKARFGEAPTDDLTASLRGGKITDEIAAILGSGMESLVGVLGT